MREKDTQRNRENDRWNGGLAEGHTPTTRPRGQGATCAMPGVRVGVLLKKKLFFIFEHFSQKKRKKNTRTSMVAAVTSSPRVRFFIFHYESGLVLKTVFDKKKLVRISPVFSSFFSHSSSKVISFLFARSEWQNGSYGGLGQRPHRHRQAPPINRRRQVGWWQIERRIR